MKHPRPVTHFSTRWCLPTHFSAPITLASEILSHEINGIGKVLSDLSGLCQFLFFQNQCLKAGLFGNSVA